MAKYDVMFACGHKETIELYGKVKERDRKIEWFERQGECSACYKKKLEEKREKERAEAEKKANESGLVELTGSEKQIKWAVTIRAAIMTNMENIKTKLDAVPEDNKSKENYVAAYAMYNKAYKLLTTKSDARFFIDIREYEDCSERYFLSLIKEIDEDKIK